MLLECYCQRLGHYHSTSIDHNLSVFVNLEVFSAGIVFRG